MPKIGNIKGPPGLRGPPGLTGDDGNPGDPGRAGDTGPPGLVGLSGAQGLPGQAGPQGLPGEDGDGNNWLVPGPAGPQGMAGLQGTAGGSGPQGLPGVHGVQGASIAGEDGEDSWPIPGIQGLQGAAGSIGDIGPQGLQGLTGAPGIQGDEGEDGFPGPPGAPGSAGTQGSQGIQGIQGVAGSAGVPGRPGLDGDDGEDGLRGPPGIIGPAGSQGIQGIPGPIGFPGDDGEDAWSIPGAQGLANYGNGGMQINGSCDISQENGTTAVVVSGYVLDGWRVDTSGAQVLSSKQLSSTILRYVNSLQVKITTAGATNSAGDYVTIGQLIEGYRIANCLFGTANAETISIGFWAVCSVTGTYCVSCRSGARSYVAEFTLTANIAKWVAINIPGDVTGTWLYTNGTGLTLSFALKCGSTFQTTANAWAAGNFLATSNQTNLAATLNATFEITGLIVLPARLGLPPASYAPLVMRSADQELIQCMRYYEKSYDLTVAPGTASNFSGSSWNYVATAAVASIANLGASLSFTVPKRVAPTVTLYSPNSGASGKLYDAANAIDVTANIYHAGQNSFQWYGTAGAATQALQFQVHWKADSRL